MRHFILGTGFVLLLLVDVWWFVAAYAGVSALLTGTTGEPGVGVYVPGCIFSIAFFAGLLWITVKVARRVAANTRRPSAGEFR